ncbi:MAG: hypothetical protein LWW95_09875 [Candidatus Desulfofervidus auxilii]|nr:hypothetical protein [Candidatus Desulfofervidus auxilii]
MKIRGIVYLHTSMGWFKKDFNRIENELRMMRDELYANAVRLEGTGITLWKITEIAMNEGLQVWAHPKVDDVVPRSKFVNIYRDFSKRAEDFGIDVLMIGNELSLEVNLESDRTFSYVERCLDMERYVHKPLREKMDSFIDFIAELVEISRKHFSGKITYAAGSWEFDLIDWEDMDIVMCNQFLYSQTKDNYLDLLLKMKSFGKPAVLSEIGFQTINRAFEAGPIWWYPRKHEVEYDEEAQARCFEMNFKFIRKADLNGCFIHEWDENEIAGNGDLGFGIMRMNGTPKKSFYTIRNFYKNWK